MSTSFADWVSTADAVRATAKKLEKHAALARYLGALDDSDLQIAARLFAGAPFPRRDERVLAVGRSALSDVLLERSGKGGGEMAESYQRHVRRYRGRARRRSQARPPERDARARHR